MDVNYYQAGVSWTASMGQVRPFASLSAGVTRLAPNSDFLPESESHFSLGLGGGVKIFLTEHVGLRLDARLLVTDTSDEDGCCYDCCYGAERDDLVQGLVSAGLVFAFQDDADQEVPASSAEARRAAAASSAPPTKIASSAGAKYGVWAKATGSPGSRAPTRTKQPGIRSR